MAIRVNVIGAGLAGSECAYRLLKAGVEVHLYEQKPVKFSPAHRSPNFAELVCSNSLKNDSYETNACGLLKEEMRRLGSVTMQAAEQAKVAAGGALTVDRDKFSQAVTESLTAFPNLTVHNEEVTDITKPPFSEHITVVATGPLTSESLANQLAETLGEPLFFFDASAPIVTKESVDENLSFYGDRYGDGTGEYLNCPLDKEDYDAFYQALVTAETVALKEFENERVFDGCMPVEVMAKRGYETLRFGPLKPVGLSKQAGRKLYACLQLRPENEEKTMYNLVGFQTNLKFPEQKRVFSLIPALKNAEFLRYGVMHKNIYLRAPAHLNYDQSLKNRPNLFFAGQITGVEGYVESAASGITCAVQILRRIKNLPPVEFPRETVMGALAAYVVTPNPNFQPMNANYGVVKPIYGFEGNKKIAIMNRAFAALDSVKEQINE
ncbi:MAG: methylenetetrahydrofolate--tRNA-(uracil(54)-C(5))-methyltransferase (FADH(2)-oxidizing) TrmFO [Clostridiales bacterium]|nr:methylenetetrahydrofolate--tRNA-(uracil(54)-C(5))-methyltransferase (FADH(2)-oxidizing) TrmFO [Clostridiales bacterium]